MAEPAGTLAQCNVLDCRPPAEPEAAPPIPRRLQPVDYLAKDYDSLLRAMLDLLPTRVPGWRDRTEADLGMAILELFAYLGDQLSYYQDRVAEEGYLRTASQYESVRKLLRLVDYHVDPGAAARAELAFDVRTAKYLTGGFETETRALEDREPVRFRTDAAVMLLPDLQPLGLLGDLVAGVDNQLTVVAELAGSPPVGSQVFLSGADGIESAVLAQPVVVDALARTTLLRLTAPVAADHPAASTRVRLLGLASDAQLGDAQVELAGEWDEALLPDASRLLLGTGAAAEWVEVAPPRAIDTVTHTTSVALAEPLSADRPAATTPVRGNGVSASHGTAREEEAVGTGEAGQTFALSFAPLTYLDDPGGEPRSTLAVRVAGEAWHEVEDFLSSGPADRHFRTTRSNDGYTTLHFGDGTRGRVPGDEDAIVASFRTGIGEAGLVARDTLTEAPTTPPEVLRFTNPLAARDAREPETLDQARLLGPLQVRRQNRAVVPEDYARVLEEGVRLGSGLLVPLHAIARFEWTGSWTSVVVSVDMPGRDPLTDAQRRAFEEALEAKRLAGFDARVEDARYAALRISLVVHVRPGFFARHVRRAIERALGARVFADGTMGFFAPPRFDFGDDVYLSDLYAAALEVEGVESLAVTRFKRLGDRYPDRESEGFIPIAPLEIARCDNDPAHPEHGVLYVRVCGGKEG